MSVRTAGAEEAGGGSPTSTSTGKRCRDCGRWYDDAAANFWKSGEGGLRPFCKLCGKAKNAAAAERKAAWYAENADRIKPRVRATTQAWAVRNRERRLAQRRAWQRAHPEKAREYAHRRIALKKQSDGQHTAEDMQRQYELQGGQCWWCDCDLSGGYEIDHVTPISRGGSNGPENIVIACQPCNRSKSDKLPEEWEGAARRLSLSAIDAVS